MRSEPGRIASASPEVEDGEATIDLLDDPGDEVALPTGIDVEDLLPLDVAKPLLDYLFGSLRGNSPEVFGCVLPLPGDVAVLVEILGVDEDVPGVRVDRDPSFFGRTRASLVGRDQRIGQRIEQHVDRDPALALEQLEGIHDIRIHLHGCLLAWPGLGARSHRKTVRAESTWS